YGIDPSLQQLNPLTLVNGAWPSGASEVAIDKAVARKKGFELGDRIGIETHSGLHRFRITGLVQFASVSSIGGFSLAAFDLRTAQELLGEPRGLDVIRVQAKSGVPTAALQGQIT